MLLMTVVWLMTNDIPIIFKTILHISKFSEKLPNSISSFHQLLRPQNVFPKSDDWRFDCKICVILDFSVNFTESVLKGGPPLSPQRKEKTTLPK